MTIVIRMQQIGLCLEILPVLFYQREQPGRGVPVDDGHRPYIASLLHRINVGIKIFAAAVGVRLIALPVFLVGMED